ncbi:hypothetical protein E2C01_059625 [Portunus trituberculatus]|uniref:Uncharacterized protein n=1 Tax=Portunus trituberculatus TaxID=210409 RepID=A0A5B7GZP7_PORTR|nr:hypothetical protein [Portunus trituberculatus]
MTITTITILTIRTLTDSNTTTTKPLISLPPPPTTTTTTTTTTCYYRHHKHATSKINTKRPIQSEVTWPANLINMHHITCCSSCCHQRCSGPSLSVAHTDVYLARSGLDAVMSRDH